jgi:DNA-binding NarL/FixJ family response regulator
VNTRTVALYGDNLVMSTIGASLQQQPGIHVQRIEGLPSEVVTKLDAAPPDVILFDLAGAQPQFTIPLLQNHPLITLIGIDLASNKMLVVSSEQSRLLTADDLLKIISP